VRVSVQLRDLPRLLALWEREPSLLAAHEDAALLVLRVLGALRDADGALALREKWRGRETQTHLWQAFDADQLMLARRAAEAVALLQGQSFAGAADCGRLLRLSLLQAGNAAKAWEFLERAYAADPKNPDVRSFRGQVLENAGQRELARIEYVAALVGDPRDAIRREQLISFYVRAGNFAQALQTCADGLGADGPDFLWLQWQFWRRMIGPDAERKTATPPGRLRPLVDQLRAQPAGVFWDWRASEGLRDLPRYTSQRQEVFWLQVWQFLREGKEAEAADLLTASRFRSTSYHRELECALRIVLRWRASDRAPVVGDFSRNPAVAVRHVLLEEIESWGRGTLGSERVLSAETRAFLRGPQAFAGLALAAGWTEAALQLVDQQATYSGEPEWFRYGLAQALRFNRGADEALAFLRRHPATPTAQLLQGEILFGRKDFAGARALLEPLAGQASDAGFRAAWLLASHAVETRDCERAERLVQGQARLRDHVLGREIRARCLWQRGDRTAARVQYEALATESTEAATFLAREALAAGDWAGARKWTQVLIDRLPDEIQLRANLAAIDAAEANAAKARR
jgi:Flp pilus assembly protein TadD